MAVAKKDNKDLREWGISLIKAIKTVGEKKSEQPLFNNVINYFETLIEDSHHNKKISVLKRIIKEIELWALNLDPVDAEEVNKIMITKFGKGVWEDSILKKVNLIIKRGIIKNLTEYRLLNEVLILYSDDISKRDIVNSVSKLVFVFEKNYKSKK